MQFLADGDNDFGDDDYGDDDVMNEPPMTMIMIIVKTAENENQTYKLSLFSQLFNSSLSFITTENKLKMSKNIEILNKYVDSLIVIYQLVLITLHKSSTTVRLMYMG